MKKKKANVLTSTKVARVTGDGWCHECQIKRGARVPNGGQMGITVSVGVCNACGEKTTIVPTCDYDWPKQGVKAIFD